MFLELRWQLLRVKHRVVVHGFVEASGVQIGKQAESVLVVQVRRQFELTHFVHRLL